MTDGLPIPFSSWFIEPGAYTGRVRSMNDGDIESCRARARHGLKRIDTTIKCAVMLSEQEWSEVNSRARAANTTCSKVVIDAVKAFIDSDRPFVRGNKHSRRHVENHVLGGPRSCWDLVDKHAGPRMRSYFIREALKFYLAGEP